MLSFLESKHLLVKQEVNILHISFKVALAVKPTLFVLCISHSRTGCALVFQ